MITVGVSRVHNAAVALLNNGDLVFQLENERLSNIKYDAYPFHALSSITKYVDAVDQLAIAGVNNTVPVESFTDHDVYTVFVARLKKSFFKNGLTTYNLGLEHHKLHAACAFYNSGFDRAVCIIKDGAGSEFQIDDPRFLPGSYGRESSSCFVASYPATFDLIDKHVSVPFETDVIVDGKIRVNNSISEALAFQAVSLHFGFHALDAGKVMGMASYGYYDSNIPPIYDDRNCINNDLFCVDKGIDQVYINLKKYPYIDTTDFQIQANFAWSLQTATQNKIKNEILSIAQTSNQKNICLSGGYFLNCVANYEFLKDLPDDINLYVEPISSDAGTALGAAKLVWHETSGDMTVRKQTSLYQGFEYNLTLDDIKSKIATEKIIPVTYQDVAELIAKKNIVAMYQGKSEVGPRALGNRSILYDPRDPKGKDQVNIVKNREWFRPFAGSVLEENVNEWFDLRGMKNSPFMMYAVDVLENKQVEIPAVTHVDGTCRVQTVNEQQNFHYYNLIKEFHNLTGVPILFNTSFNLAGDCIVETIDDAFNTLRNSKINYLYLPEFNCLISKI
jgi:carbamoyltransferase